MSTNRCLETAQSGGSLFAWLLLLSVYVLWGSAENILKMVSSTLSCSLTLEPEGVIGGVVIITVKRDCRVVRVRGLIGLDDLYGVC